MDVNRLRKLISSQTIIQPVNTGNNEANFVGIVSMQDLGAMPDDMRKLLHCEEVVSLETSISPQQAQASSDKEKPQAREVTTQDPKTTPKNKLGSKSKNSGAHTAVSTDMIVSPSLSDLNISVKQRNLAEFHGIEAEDVIDLIDIAKNAEDGSLNLTRAINEMTEWNLTVGEYGNLVSVTEEVNAIIPESPNISRDKLNKLGDLFSELKVSDQGDHNDNVNIANSLEIAYEALEPHFQNERYFGMASVVNMLIAFGSKQETATLDAAVEGLIELHQRIDEAHSFDPEGDPEERDEARTARFDLYDD